MKRSIIVKIIFDIAATVAFALFVGGAVFIKFFKGVLTKSEISADLTAKIIEQNVIFLTAILIVLILILITAIYFSLKRTIINPLKKLHQGAEIIADGNLNYKVRDKTEIQPENEIDQLAKSFDEMSAKLKESYGGLERKVKQKTEEIVQKVKNLENIKIALYNILEDIEKNRDVLKNERDKLNTIISSMGEGLFVLDNNLRVVLINDAAAQMLEISAEKALGKNRKEILSLYKGKQEISGDDLPAAKMLKTGQTIKIGMEDDFYYSLPSGKKFPITLVDTPLKRGNETIGAIIIFRDITNEKKLDESKTNFISIASHQLRTPLTTIRWYTEMLESEDVGKLNKNQKSFLNEIYSAVLRLAGTLNMLLALARIESGLLKLNPLKINLHNFTEGIIKDLEPLIKPKNIKIEIVAENQLPEITLDSLMINQVISNLLTNSIRYSDEKGKIEIKIGRRENEILYSVKDNGIGVPPEEQARLFERFFRAENAVLKAPDGNGLGLYLVKNLVELWKGKIWFESPADWGKEKKGTAFYFTIPL